MKLFKTTIISVVMLFSSLARAQVSVNVNIGSPPLWGPVGYSDVQYYYIPDVEAYYDVPASMFIYYSGGSWVRRANLPKHYKYYDLYNGYKVVITDYRGNEPYIHFKDHKVKYYKGYKGGAQKNIGEKPGKGNNRSNAPSNVKDKGQQQDNIKTGNTAGNKKSSHYENSDRRQQKGNGSTNERSKGHKKIGNHGDGGKKK